MFALDKKTFLPVKLVNSKTSLNQIHLLTVFYSRETWQKIQYDMIHIEYNHIHELGMSVRCLLSGEFEDVSAAAL